MVGFVFFPPSPRAVTPAQAAALSAAPEAGPQRVGLFVDPDDELSRRCWQRCRSTCIQLHGDETPGALSPKSGPGSACR